MRKSWVAGFLVFSVVLIVGARHEAVDEFLVWAGICASDSRTPARSASLVLAAVQNASTQSSTAPPVSCPPPPAGYQILPEVSGSGDVTVPLALGTGAGLGTGNQNLCLVANSLPAAPVIRIKRGNRLTVKLINTLRNTGPDNTQNCPIENYVDGPPASSECSQPEQGFKALPGANGSFSHPVKRSAPRRRHLQSAHAWVRCVAAAVFRRGASQHAIRGKLGRARCAAAPVSRRAQRAHLQLRYRIG